MALPTPVAESLVTLDDYAALPRDLRCELVEGELRELTAPKKRHSRLQMAFLRRLDRYLVDHPIGEVGAEFGFILGREPDTIRSPDVFFVRSERDASVGPDEWMEGAPDLAIEILSPSNRPGEIRQKIEQYFRAGGRLVWVVDSLATEVRVHRADGATETISDTLEAPELLPGLKIDLREI